MKKIVLALLFSIISLFAYEELNIDNFDSKIKDKNVIVDFYASCCPPCKIVATNLEDFDVIKAENVEIYKVDVDAQLTLAITPVLCHSSTLLTSIITTLSSIIFSTILGCKSTKLFI